MNLKTDAVLQNANWAFDFPSFDFKQKFINCACRLVINKSSKSNETAVIFSFSRSWKFGFRVFHWQSSQDPFKLLDLFLQIIIPSDYMPGSVSSRKLTMKPIDSCFPPIQSRNWSSWNILEKPEAENLTSRQLLLPRWTLFLSRDSIVGFSIFVTLDSNWFWAVNKRKIETWREHSKAWGYQP